MTKPTVFVYFSDNGDADLYKLTREQFEELQEKDDWDTIEKFKIDYPSLSAGYAPSYLCKLAELFGFEVDSI